jgi:Arylsulfotransferase (ASST)
VGKSIRALCIGGLCAIAASAVGVPGTLTRAAAASTTQFSTQPSLYPSFSRSITYYVTRCANSPVSVTATVVKSDRISVDGQPAKGGTFTTSVPLTAGQEFLITIANAGGQHGVTYHVRCLPSDFPNWTAQKTGTTQAAFYLVTPNLAVPAPHYVAMFDPNGTPRWWLKTGSAGSEDAKVLPDGNLAWSFPVQPNPSVEVTLAGSQVRTFPASGSYSIDFHDLRVMPNGTYFRSVVQQITADTTWCGGGAGTTIMDPLLQEIDSTGNLVWSWDVAAHIPITEVQPEWFPECRGGGTASTPGDPYHFNSIDLKGTNAVVSFRHLDAVYQINNVPTSNQSNLPASNIVWKLGGSTRSDNTSLTVLNDPEFTAAGGFSGQHDAGMLSDGTVTLYDDQSRHSGAAPRGVRYQISPPSGTAAGTASLLEQITDSAITNSPYTGSARKLAGGNWVIAWGGNPQVGEYTPQGTRVFWLSFDSPRFSYRAYPVTSAQYSDAQLTSGMNTQFPR